MKLAILGEQFYPAQSSRIIQFIGCSLILFLGAITPARAQDISSIKSMLAAKQCPPSEYSRISYDDRGCGWPAQKACDQRYRAPSQAWQDCYHQLGECRKQIDADNQVVYEANRVFRLCNQHQSDTDQSSTGSRPKTGHSSSNSPSQNDSGSSDLASRLASQRAKNATADEVRRQQDQQFSDTVRSTQQQYQQFKAREQTEQAANPRAPSQQTSTPRNQRAPDPGCSPGAPYRGQGQSCWPTPPPNHQAPNAPVDNCTALHSCDAGCGPPSDATAACWNACLSRYGRC